MTASNCSRLLAGRLDEAMRMSAKRAPEARKARAELDGDVVAEDGYELNGYDRRIADS